MPITAKKVPGGVPDMRSTITSRPEIAHAEINPANEQYNINNLVVFCDSMSCIGSSNIKTSD
jgi:hypothetical protein